MPKRFTLLFLSILILQVYSYGQVTKDDVRVDIITNNPFDIHRLDVFPSLTLGPNVYSFGGVSYLQPKRFLAMVRGAWRAVDLEGTVFFANFYKNKLSSQTVDFQPGTPDGVPNYAHYTRYYVKHNVPKGRSLGLHGGWGTSVYILAADQTAEYFFGGITFLSCRYSHLYARTDREFPIKKSMKLLIYADYVRYYNHQSDKPEWNLYNGARLNLESYIGVSSKSGLFGLRYLVGVSMQGYKKNAIAFNMGFGLNFTFVSSKKPSPYMLDWKPGEGKKKKKSYK